MSADEADMDLSPESLRLLKVLFQRNRAQERLDANEYQDPEQRRADAVFVALPQLLQAAGAALDQALTQSGDELLTIEDGPDDVTRRHPELTRVPLAVFRLKGRSES
ncbi:hypothetical protein [Streptomyces sp. NPDC090112]|uniref:hypothetical protein n=1 Tax=Streptomyces sp. NPDC090112 TaxID=3365949 RepID=UPI00382C5CA8